MVDGVSSKDAVCGRDGCALCRRKVVSKRRFAQVPGGAAWRGAA